MYSKLLELINQITSLEEIEIELIKNSFKPLLLNKGEFFLRRVKLINTWAFSIKV